MSLVRTIAATSLRKRPGSARTAMLLVAAALLALAIFAALWMRRGGAGAAQVPVGTQAVQPTESARESDRNPGAERQVIEAEAPPPSADGSTPILTFQYPFAEPKKATLTVELVADGAPAAGGSVAVQPMFDGTRTWKTIDPATGRASFADLPVGPYHVTLDDLPVGWIGPSEFMRGGSGTSLDLPENGRTRRIELERGAHLFGRITLPDGSAAKSAPPGPIPNPRVVVWHKPEDWPGYVIEDDFGLTDGRYECTVHAGLRVLTVAGMPELDSPGAKERLALPRPALRRLAAGSSTNVDFAYRERGSARVVGMAQDDAGQPFADLRLELAECFTLTEPGSGEVLAWDPVGRGTRVRAGADGRFEFPGLEPGRFSLWIEPGNCSPLIPPDRAKIGEYPPPRFLALGDGDTPIEVKVRRAHPVQVNGSIVVDSAWAAAHSPADEVFTLALVYATGNESNPEARSILNHQKDAFAFWVEATLTNTRLELTLGEEQLVLPLTLPTAGEFAPLSIRFPR